MRLFNASGLIAGALALGVAGAAIGQETPPPIPVGIKIPVVLTETISSGTAHVGDRFSFKTSKDVKLGSITLAAGTPGHGRLAVVQPAQGKQHGNISLQADAIDPASGDTIWVNIDTNQPPKGRLAKKVTRPVLIPVPFIGGVVQTTSGDLVLDSGIPFGVVTILPRRAPAPLLTAPPTPEPSTPPGSAVTPGPATTPALGATPGADATPGSAMTPEPAPSPVASAV